jgi:hypothetical protein
MNQLYAQDWKNDVRRSNLLSGNPDAYLRNEAITSATQAVNFFA